MYETNEDSYSSVISNTPIVTFDVKLIGTTNSAPLTIDSEGSPVLLPKSISLFPGKVLQTTPIE